MMLTALALALTALAAPPAPASTPSHALQPLQKEELDRDAFMDRYRRALDARAESEIENLVRRNQGTATVLIIELCEANGREPSERLENEIEGLRKAWKIAFNSSFANEMYEYLSLMRQQVRAFRSEKKQDFIKIQRELQAGTAEKNWERVDVACEQFAALAEAFSQAGDHYYVSECWWRIAQAYDEGVRGNKANLEKAGEGFANCVEARDRIDLKDRFYSAAKLRADQLLGSKEREAERSEKAAAEGFTRKKAGASLGPEVGYDLTFSILEDIENPLRPGFELLELPIIWRQLSFKRPGSATDFYTFGDKGPQMIRTSGGVAMDADRDGKGEVEITLTGNIEATEVTLGEGDSLRKWGFLSIVLTDSEVYQGIGLPMQPSDAFMSLFVGPAGSMVGEVDGTSIQVIDENMDGVYGSTPVGWGNPGLTPQSVQPIFDTIVVGGAKRAVPWSEYIELGSQWYQLLSDQNGTRVVASKAQLETGTLKLSAKGIKPLYFVVRGTGTFQYSYFDVMTGGSRGIDVPAGSYELLIGEVRKGKRKQVQKAMILSGKGTDTWTVNPGETTTIEIGAPFDVDFDVTDGGGVVKVTGGTIAIVGSAKERYERLWNCTLEPEAFVRKAGTKKGGRGVKMDTVRDYESIQNEGLQIAWFPLDIELKKRTDDEEVEVQLIEKKNKLFGKLESSWRKAGGN